MQAFLCAERDSSHGTRLYDSCFDIIGYLHVWFGYIVCGREAVPTQLLKIVLRTISRRMVSNKADYMI